MTRRLLPCLVLLTLLPGTISPLAAQNAEGEVEIQYNLEPAPDAIRPDEETVRLRIHLALNGQPVDGPVQVILDSPPASPFVSTDFPVVEGTRLIDATGVTLGGMLDLTYLFPIRGQYNLRVVAPANPAAGYGRAEKTFHFSVNENPGEVLNFFLLMGGLILFGLVSGLVLARGSKQRALLLAGAVFLSTGLSAHDPAKHRAPPAPGDEPRDFVHMAEAGYDLKLKVVPARSIAPGAGQDAAAAAVRFAAEHPEDQQAVARVGDLAYLVGGLTHHGRTVRDVRYELNYFHLEDEKDVFTTAFRAPEGNFVWGQQFFDGAEHRVSLKAVTADGREFKTALVLGVEGIQPPPASIVKTLVLMLGAMALAMVTGYVLGFRLTGAPAGA